MHQDFSVDVVLQVEIPLRQNFFAQLGIVRQLPVEPESEPLRFFDVLPLERLPSAVEDRVSRWPGMRSMR